MGFWNKFGKIALQAAPYVAAPFTGGASLYAVPATQKIGQKWAASDANKAAAKGLAPSKFDKYLGMASNIAGMAGSAGAFGQNNAEKLGGGGFGGGDDGGGGGWQGIVGQMSRDPRLLGMMDQGGRDYAAYGNDMPSQGGITGNMPYSGSQQRAPQGGLGPSEQAVSRNLNRTPNLEDYISQGHEEALYDQPWRKPYPASIYKGIGGNRRFQGSYEQGISPGSY